MVLADGRRQRDCLPRKQPPAQGGPTARFPWSRSASSTPRWVNCWPAISGSEQGRRHHRTGRTLGHGPPGTFMKAAHKGFIWRCWCPSMSCWPRPTCWRGRPDYPDHPAAVHRWSWLTSTPWWSNPCAAWCRKHRPSAASTSTTRPAAARRFSEVDQLTVSMGCTSKDTLSSFLDVQPLGETQFDALIKRVMDATPSPSVRPWVASPICWTTTAAALEPGTGARRPKQEPDELGIEPLAHDAQPAAWLQGPASGGAALPRPSASIRRAIRKTAVRPWTARACILIAAVCTTARGDAKYGVPVLLQRDSGET